MKTPNQNDIIICDRENDEFLEVSDIELVKGPIYWIKYIFNVVAYWVLGVLIMSLIGLVIGYVFYTYID